MWVGVGITGVIRIVAGVVLGIRGVGVGVRMGLVVSALLVEVELEKLVVDLDGSFLQALECFNATGINQSLANQILEPTTEILHEGSL